MFNVLNRVKGFDVQKSEWSKQCTPKCKWLETNKMTAEWKAQSIAKNAIFTLD